MFTSNRLAMAVRCAALGMAAASTLAVPAVNAAENKAIEDVERIQVTGSSIKRTDMEGSLPVQIIGSEEIAQLGVTSVPDLVAQLPAMSGFTTSGDSVGGTGGGLNTASIHDLGESYTLVLLNGRRLAPTGSGSTIDLNSIPLAAVKQVEVLTDGASALYGSDAIAGVVNFIMKDNFEGFDVSARYDQPVKSGGESLNFSVTAGFGDLDVDGFNFMAAYSHDSKAQLASVDRDFSKKGFITFEHEGEEVLFFNGSPNAIAGNARTRILDDNGDVVETRTWNPYQAKNGECAENNFMPVWSNECWFDYTSTIEIYPESERDSIFLTGQLALTDDLIAYAEATVSKYSVTSRIAPYPTGHFNLPADSQVVIDNVIPYLTDEEAAAYAEDKLQVQARWRALPAGNRTTEYLTNSTHIVAGIKGTLFYEYDIDTAFTYSKNDQDQNYPTGWLLADKFVELASTGAFNVFAPIDEFTAEDKAALAPAVYSGNWDNQVTEMKAFDAKVSGPVMSLPAGDVYFGAGADYREYTYTRSIADANKNAEILFLSTDDPYELNRANYGAFAEIIIPVLDGLEVTGSLRYDNLGAVTDELNGGVELNDSEGGTTYKLSARYTVNEDLVVRASFGTGFKAPSMLEIGRPRAEFGVTSASYVCPFEGTDDPLAAACKPGKEQQHVFLQGNYALKNETSEQIAVGFAYAPSKSFSVTMDYWNVEMDNRVTELEEAQIFADPQRYRDLFTTKTNLATNEEELAIILAAANVGKSKYAGIDWTVNFSSEIGKGGTLTNTFMGTYYIDSKYTRPGDDTSWTSSLGKFGEDQSVTFERKLQWQARLETGNLTQSLTLNYQSGYKDEVQSADDCYIETLAGGECRDVALNVSSYAKFDYQARYQATDNLAVTAGVNNLFDVEPNFSLRTGGAGHQVGFDPRYNDVFGRTLYLQGDYSF